MVDQQTFEQMLWKLNESGDYHTTYNMLNIVLQMAYKDHSGVLIDFAYLVKKYTGYLAWWESKFGDKDPRFIRNADNLKSIYDFLGDGMYQNDWKAPRKARDFYLFGELTEEDLKTSLAQFKASLNENQSQKETGSG